MTSTFQRALGSDFERLHPQLQRRFGVGLADGEGCVGTGVMDRIWHGGRFVRPFLRLGATRNILVPETGHAIPFTIENYPYADSYGRETVTFVRTFALPGRSRRFDATMIYSEERGGIVEDRRKRGVVRLHLASCSHALYRSDAVATSSA